MESENQLPAEPSTSQDVSNKSKSDASEDEFEEAREDFESDSSSGDESFHDPVEFLAQLVSSEASRVVNEEISGFQSFIERRRMELDAELHNLAARQNTSNRSNLETHLNRIQSNHTETDNSQPPVYRSVNVLAEIQQLGQMNRVSGVLSTAGSRIEQTLRNLLQSRSAAVTVRPTPAPVIVQPQPIEPISIEQITREQIVDEISVLVHRQLVSSTLQSGFRSTLERRIMDRMRHLGIENGNQTQELVRNLSPSNPIQRNDFSNLGITDTPTQSRLTSTNNSRDIRDLKREVGELKQMLKLSFETQLDMQRALKQEISALIAGTWNNPAASQLVSSTRASHEGSCVICTEGGVDSVFYQCGHMCTCYSCARTLMDKQLNCPVCRAPIKDILRAYKVGLD